MILLPPFPTPPKMKNQVLHERFWVAAIGVIVVSVGIIFWHLQFKERVRKVKEKAAKEGGRATAHGIWKE